MVNDTKLDTLKALASAALADGIEAMHVDPMQLVAHGYSFPLATALATAIESGRPDIGALRGFGVDQVTAISICSAIAKRHDRVARAMASVPVAKPEPTRQESALASVLAPVAEPEPVAPIAKQTGIVGMNRPAIAGRLSPEALAAALSPVVMSDAEPIGRLNAMSVLHTLAVSIEAERACPTELANAGLSAATARELALLINSLRS